MAGKAATENVEENKSNAEPKFSKEQIAASKRYAKDVDIVMALLDSDKEYTFEEVDGIINKFNNKKDGKEDEVK